MHSSRQASKELEGILTEVVIQQYVDSVFVLVTQLGKVGNLIQVSLPATTPLPPPSSTSDKSKFQLLPQPPIAIQLTPLLGHAPSDRIQTLHNLYASQIATLVWAADPDVHMQITRENVIVGIALRKTDSIEASDLSEPERNTFIGVMKMIQELQAQS